MRRKYHNIKESWLDRLKFYRRVMLKEDLLEITRVRRLFFIRDRIKNGSLTYDELNRIAKGLGLKPEHSLQIEF